MYLFNFMSVKRGLSRRKTKTDWWCSRTEGWSKEWGLTGRKWMEGKNINCILNIFMMRAPHQILLAKWSQSQWRWPGKWDTRGRREFFPSFGEGTWRKRWRARRSFWEDNTDTELKETRWQNVTGLIWLILRLIGVHCERDHKPSHSTNAGNFLT